MTDPKPLVIYDANRKSKRRCGDCQLCCRLLPVAEIAKPALTKCQHQCRKGCAVYDRKPFTCGLWDCLWLQGQDTGPRPDRAHLCIDPIPDFVRMTNSETGEQVTFNVRQVWIDPAHPDAHKAPAFRRWLEQEARENGFMALIRTGSHKGFLLCPPALADDGQWHEKESGFDAEPEHSAADIQEKLGADWRVFAVDEP